MTAARYPESRLRRDWSARCAACHHGRRMHGHLAVDPGRGPCRRCACEAFATIDPPFPRRTGGEAS